MKTTGLCFLPCVLLLVVQASAQEAPQRDDGPRPTTALALEAALRERLGAPMDSLDFDLIMYGEDFFGAQPQRLRWSDDSKTLFFSWKRWDQRERKTYAYDLSTEALSQWPEAQPTPRRGTFDAQRTLRVWRDGPRIQVDDLELGTTKTAITLASSVSDLGIAYDAKSLSVVTREGVFRYGLASPEWTQLLSFKSGNRKSKDKKKKVEKGEKAAVEGEAEGEVAKEAKAEAEAEAEAEADKKQADKPITLGEWHEDKQQELFRVLYESKQRSERRKKNDKALEEARIKVSEWRAPKGWNRRDVVVSPGMNVCAVVLGKELKKKPRVADMPDYVTKDGYARVRGTRPKVGDLQGRSKIELCELHNGEVQSLKLPDALKDVSISSPSFSADGSQLVARARSDNDEHSWLLRIDQESGEVTVLHRYHDPAWVSWSEGSFQWLGDSNALLFSSEATGWMHLYHLDVASGEVRSLTKGTFEVSSPQATEDGATVFAIATPTSPHVRDLVRIDVATGEMTILTADGGGRTFSLSPDGKRIAEVWSVANKPWELRLRDATKASAPVIEDLTDSPSPAFKSFGAWRSPPIVQIPADDGVMVPARIYRPENPAPGKPAVLFVHGAGYLQNVHGWWSNYYREYGFHHLLAAAGYTVLDVDYRGSAGYGRDWRTAIYGHMGKRDLGDYVCAAEWLAKEEGCSPERMGIYGGSYGGFMTLMALFTKPGVFQAGAALRPVTDWAHYNDGYTSNILDDPLESPQHYQLSSPIGFAEGLEDHLLICHGVLDSNVHAQGVFRLQQRLIELRKRRWEVAYYPLEGHGFKDPASWSDEYRRIRELFDRVLKR